MLGMSAATRARKAGAAADPVVGPANTTFALAVVAPVPPLATGNVPLICVVSPTLPHVGAVPTPPLRSALPVTTSASVDSVVAPLAYNRSPMAYDAIPVPPRSGESVPDVPEVILIVGISAATSALNAGAAADPVVGPANTVLALALVMPVPPLATGKVPL